MKLIPNWQDAFQLDTVKIGAALATLSVLQAEVLPLIGFAIPATALPWVTAIFGLATVLLRLRKQPGVTVG